MGVEVAKDETQQGGRGPASHFASLPKTQILKKHWAKLLVLLLVVASIGTATYFYNENKTLKGNTNAAAEKEVSDLTKKVGKIIDLPNEIPTVATVKDTEKLKEQPFFKKAENGDRVLIYTKSRQAIIYREKDNKVINVGPITIDSNNKAIAP